MAGLLVLGLGCAGTAEMLGDLAGLEAELNFGEDAVHPDDFPMDPPAEGTPQMSAGLTTASEAVNLPDGVEIELQEGQRYRTHLITYRLAPDAVDAAVDTAMAALSEGGYAEQPLEDSPPDANAHLMVQGTEMFLVLGGADDEGVLVLMRIRPADDPEAGGE